jgi:hypothetical protein
MKDYHFIDLQDHLLYVYNYYLSSGQYPTVQNHFACCSRYLSGMALQTDGQYIINTYAIYNDDIM